MPTCNLFRSTLVTASWGLALLLCSAPAAQAQSIRNRNAAEASERKTARYFESIRKSPPQMFAFLKAMPKGGDIHTHLSGAVYAESYIQWAAAKGSCVNQATLALTPPPCDEAAGRPPASAALSNPVLYRQLIDAWSMRNAEYSGQSGHDHFFDTFGKFAGATFGRMLAEVSARAARGRVSYLEVMLTPDGGRSSVIGAQVGWDGDFEGTLNKLKSNGLPGAAAAGAKALRDAEAEKDGLLKCGTPHADPGCSVTIRYVSQVSRGAALGQVFAQMVTGFTLANDPKSRVVALTLVQPEDSFLSMQNFTVQMEMLDFLRPRYPNAHITLHAGELAPGAVPPEGLSFHIRESVMKGHAERIGHGVDIMHEDDPYGLLKELAQRNVMIEICLTSSDTILGIRKEQHPLTIYLEYGVPVALATDDEGVARSEISREYLKAAEEHGLGYIQLKRMARTSLQHAFLTGSSLWSDARRFRRVPQCMKDTAMTGRFWTEEDSNAIEELFIPDGQGRGLGATVLVGPQGFKQFHAALCGLLCNILITIDKSVESGDWISAVCTLRAKSRRTGAPVEITGSVLVRIADGKLTEAYNHWDFLGMFSQLGLLPGDTFEKALRGEKVI
jgi:adenosine deaminase